MTSQFHVNPPANIVEEVKPQEVGKIDIVIPTVDNASWLQRCVCSIFNNTPDNCLGNVVVVGGKWEELGPALKYCKKIRMVEGKYSWREAMVKSAEFTNGPVAIYIHDDCIITPGNPNWVLQLLHPFTLDKHVAAVASLVNDVSSPAQSACLALQPGYYYCPFIVPVIVMARTAEWVEAIAKVPHDIFCDQEVSLNLLEQGWKLVVATNVCHYHQSFQSNGRIYANGNVDKWIQEARDKIREELPKRHSLAWLSRIDECEMVPMVNHYAVRPEGIEVKLV